MYPLFTSKQNKIIFGRIVNPTFYLWNSSNFENTIKWQSDTIAVDGFSTDWKNNLRYYNEDTKMRYGITNDSVNLYFCFQVADRMMQMKIIRAGMDVTLKTKTKPKRTATISFPLPENSTNDLTKKSVQSGESFLLKQNFLLSDKQAVATGFSLTNGTIDDKNQKSIAYKINWDKGDLMNCEFRIPLIELFDKDFKLNLLANQDIALLVTINALDKPETKEKDRDDSEQRSPENGMNNSYDYQQMGGNGAGGLQGNQSNSMHTQFRSPLYEIQTLKYKFRLCPHLN